MAYSPTTLLSLPIITTGTESGAWGNVTNNGLTQYLDIAIAGSLSLTTDADVNLSNTAGTDTVTNIGSTTAQYMVLNCTGSRTVTRNINAPKQSKLYVVINATTGGQSVVLRGGPTSPTTGVTVANGATALCAWNGSDYVLIGASGNVTLSANNAFTGANTFYNATGQTFAPATTNDGIIIQGRAGGSSTYRVTFATATLSANRTLTFPDATDTAAVLGTAQTFTAAQTFRAASAIRSEAASTQDAVVIAGRAGGSGSYAVTLTPATLAASRTLTLPEPGEDVTLGYLNIPQNSQSTSYTLVLADAGKHIFHPSSDNNARTFTIPANSSVAYPIGTAITFINMAAANVTIAITSDTMYLSSAGTTGSRTLAQYGSATAVKITSTNWIISGSGLT
jgi:hypothetical protein